MKFIGYRTLKTGIGAAIAMLISQKIGLDFYSSAGIITILSIQNTKKQSVKIALKRIIACILGLCISSILFKLFGFNIINFGMFLLIFIPLTVRLNVSDGIVMSSVIVTHLLNKKNVNIGLISNEIQLVFIGVGVALLLNLYMPSVEEKIKEDQLYIEGKMREILIHMSIALREHHVSIKEDELFKNLELRLHTARSRAYNNLNNYFLLDMSYYVQYMEMTMQQFETIKRMRSHFQRFYMTFDQTIMIAEFTERVANSIYKEDTDENLLNELYLLRQEFRKSSLPVTREEFENRAVLFQFLSDLEQFLKIKDEFKQGLETEK